MACFNISDYSEGLYCMHCVTTEEAELFLDYLSSVGRCFRSGDKYSDPTMRAQSLEYGENTCYFFNEGAYGDISTAIEDNFNILEFSDFDWSGFESSSVDQDEDLSFSAFLAQFKPIQEACYAQNR